jgi:hypothetical protein
VPSQRGPAFSRWLGRQWRHTYLFLGMDFRQRNAACLLLMSRGAGSAVLWVLNEGRARIPSDQVLSSDRLAPVHDRSLVYVRWSNEDTTIHGTAHCIAPRRIPLGADYHWIVIGVLQVVWSSIVVDPESRLWITSWSFDTRRTTSRWHGAGSPPQR